MNKLKELRPTISASSLDSTGFVLTTHLLGSARLGIAPILPISRQTMYRAIRDGSLPTPVRLGPRLLGWPAAQLKSWIEGIEAGAEGAL